MCSLGLDTGFGQLGKSKYGLEVLVGTLTEIEKVRIDKKMHVIKLYEWYVLIFDKNKSMESVCRKISGRILQVSEEYDLKCWEMNL